MTATQRQGHIRADLWTPKQLPKITKPLVLDREIETTISAFESE